MVGKSLPCRGQSECKAPEKGGCSASWRSSQEASVSLGVGGVVGRRERRGSRQRRGRRGQRGAAEGT